MGTTGDSDMAVNLVLELDGRLQTLRNMWDEIGVDGAQRAERMAAMILALGSVLDEMAGKEQAVKEELLQSIDRCRSQIELLSTELHLPPPADEADGTLGSGRTPPMLKLERELGQQVDALVAEKAERLRQLEQLRNADRLLCAALSAAPFEVPDGVADVPTRELLLQLEAHVTARRLAKQERQERLLADRSAIVGLYGVLGYEPGTAFERDLAAQEPDCFVLSDDNMEALRELHERLVQLRHDRLTVGTELREQLTTLWLRLELPEAELKDIMSRHSGHRLSDIEALRGEIESCERRRVEQVRRRVDSSRTELQQWWSKCYYSDKQRAAFAGFASEAFGEELLRAHETELERVRAYYEANRKLLQKLERWDELWKLKLELVTKERDPARLENRGGVLLDEEEERKKITLLPKVEDHLREAVKAWEASQGRSFLCNGVKFTVLARQRREEYDRRKEEEKQQRLNRRRTLTPGTPVYLT